MERLEAMKGAHFANKALATARTRQDKVQPALNIWSQLHQFKFRMVVLNRSNRN